MKFFTSDKSKQGQIDRLQEYAYSKYLESQGIDPDIAKSIASKTNSNVKAKKAKKEERINAIESTAQTAIAVTAMALTMGAAAPAAGAALGTTTATTAASMTSTIGSVLSGTASASTYLNTASIALSTAIGSRKGGAQGAAAGLLNGLVSSVAPLKYNDLPVALNISFDKKNGWGGGLAIGGNSMNGSIQVSQRGGAQIEVGSKFGSVNYNTANGTYGANVSVTGLLNAGKEPLLPAEFTQGLFKNIGANIGWNSRTGASASISYNVNNPDTNKPITGLGLNVDRQGSHLTGNVEGTNLFTSSSDGSFQINTNFANERLTNNAVNEAQDAFDKEMNRRETVAADTALRDAKPPLPPPYNVDPSEMTPELREKALKLLGNRMGKDNKAAGTSRTSYLDHLVGGVTDGFQNLGTALGLSRDQVSSTTGFVDADGKFYPRTCFTKGTKIHKLKDSIVKEKDIDSLIPSRDYEELANIEDVKINDYVLTKDDRTGKLHYKPVTELFLNKVELLFEIVLSSRNKITTTWNHPFWVEGKGWTEAKDIREKDNLLQSNGDILSVSSISQVPVSPTDVYNFEVDETHSYFVGVDGIWVHNYSVDQFLKDLTVDIAEAGKKWEEAELNKKNKLGFVTNEEARVETDHNEKNGRGKKTNQQVYEDMYNAINDENTGYRGEIINRAFKYKEDGFDNTAKLKEFEKRSFDSLSEIEKVEYDILKQHAGRGVVVFKPGSDGNLFPLHKNWNWVSGADGTNGNWECNRMQSKVRKDVGVDRTEVIYGNYDFSKSSDRYKLIYEKEYTLGAKEESNLKNTKVKKGDVLVLTTKINTPGGIPPSHLAIFTGDGPEVIEMSGAGMTTRPYSSYDIPGGYYLQQSKINHYLNNPKNPVEIIGSKIALYSPKVTMEYFNKVAKEKFNLKQADEQQAYWGKYKKENPDNYFEEPIKK